MIKDRARISFSVGRPKHKNQLNHSSVCFARKPSVKIVFYIFQCLVAPKKNWSMENYFWSTENSNKYKAYFQ